jgi:pyridoxal phosphate enzyme (YggS family)
MLPEIVKRIAAASERAGRKPEEITLVAVTKGRTVEEIETAVLKHGHRILAENRVQEWRRKAVALNNIEWHLVGNLQRNKVKYCSKASLIHSLNSKRLADALQLQGSKRNHCFHTLIEVNMPGEEAKQGIMPEDVAVLLDYTRTLDNVVVDGLMGMAPFNPDPEASRPTFQDLRTLRDELHLEVLSMGMSGDFEVAIEEGATLVRIGSALFA